ncbi:MAG: hypothetical protein KatS3mg076_1720 [Candidatus Binatia bacterium]|nr:MAG: hypothetical protein KatS3mg076_1720 [Candidatus Binatia bacterium]
MIRHRSPTVVARVDLRGVPCPLNWARAKVRLESLPDGEALEFLLDDPRAVRDLPRAAEAAGYYVLESEPADEGSWRVVISKS